MKKNLQPLKSLKKPVGYALHFYAVVQQSPKTSQWRSGLFGWNHELVYAGEYKKNLKDAVDLLNEWYPEVIIKIKKAVKK
jgi:hypothetical protein